ncbi:hypothetical protein LINGRAHAP2_LOCUS994 [Linum grandiflorum]
MEEQADYGVTERSISSKMVGDKRGCDELGGDQEINCKRVKMRNTDCVLSSKDADSSQVERSVTTSLTRSADVNHVPGQLDLNSEACIGSDARRKGVLDAGEHDKCMMTMISSQGMCLDLNAEDVASSVVNSDRFYTSKTHKSRPKSRDNVSECASAIGGSMVVDKDPLKVWKEMKQNGFLSSPHGGISSHNNLVSSSSSLQGPPHGGVPVPKQRGRKPKNDTLKRRMELAKKEQVDRFTKIAAPSGLLNDLNPGIINHVRNSRQVRSIIEALVKSEKLDNITREESHLRAGSKEPGGEMMMASSHAYDSGFLSRGNEFSDAVYGSKQTGAGLKVSTPEGNSSSVREIPGDSALSYSHPVDENDNTPALLKLSSSIKASGESTSVSNNESADVTNASSLSVKAASVASQWLELLQQDIKGRLTALRRSKKRVRDVITTELPLLVTKEFGSNQENDPRSTHAAASPPFSLDATAAMHQARWNQLFDQMDRALSEEQRQLESWLNQLKEMQLHCDQGLQHFQWNAIVGFQPPGMPDHYRIPKGDSSEKELAVRAAAASIYSTCNFLMSKENVSCF